MKKRRTNGKRKVFGGSSILAGVSSIVLLFFGVMGAIFASLGICLFCVMPVLTFLLGIFGLSIGVISDYNKLFITAGIFSLGLTFYLWKKRNDLKKECKTCKVPERK